jgi:hypothetical protein
MTHVYTLVPAEGPFKGVDPADTDGHRITRLAYGDRTPRTWRAARGRFFAERGARVIPDYLSCAIAPCFSPRAVEALREVLEANGRLYPLETDEGTYRILRVTTVVEGLDIERSLFEGEGDWRFLIARHVFRESQLTEGDIFRMPYLKISDIYVTERFRQLVADAGLVGFRFRPVWDGLTDPSARR